MKALVLLLLCLAACRPSGLAAQEAARELRDSQLRLDEIRSERRRLETEVADLRDRVRDVSSEIAAILRMRSTTADALRELDYQTIILSSSIDSTTRLIEATRQRLGERTSALNGRLRWIYKQGPLYTAQVLLSAHSFADLLNRYRYLQVIALNDRALVAEIGRLERQLVEQDRFLRSSLILLEQLRTEQLDEDTQLRSIESQRARVLETARTQERSLAERLDQLARNEIEIGDLISSRERSRRDEERRAAVAGDPAPQDGHITTADLGSLLWPVEGRLIYVFGTEVRPDGVRIRWNGIGIAAAGGSPVFAVEGGTVALAGPLSGYGPSVMVSHGQGYYTLYLGLGTLAVHEAERVEPGQRIGTVGSTQSPEGPHIEFRVHAPGPGGSPVPVDPLGWLRAREAR
jgi:septal ring factor EnvC (AmiA/AmiB activator)